ncbi:MAG: hypothetical protein JW864_16180 [Spirochaetes bacterium]|nr:hypothetical protein [Spirochaetota bacterium]
MKENKMRAFMYKCKCGYTISVFIDYGIPQEFVKCRKCSTMIKRLND